MQGDDGGPLTLNGKLVGVLNFDVVGCGLGYPYSLAFLSIMNGFANGSEMLDVILFILLVNKETRIGIEKKITNSFVA